MLLKIKPAILSVWCLWAVYIYTFDCWYFSYMILIILYCVFLLIIEEALSECAGGGQWKLHGQGGLHDDD